MFLAIIFIVLGVFLLLNAIGIVINANFWGFFWAIIFLAIGIKMLMRRGKCPMCEGYWWSEKAHGKMHDHNCNCDEDNDDEEEEEEE